MSPIENVWSWMKDELWKIKNEITTKKILFETSKKLFLSKKASEFI
jgi:hypothetical protein